MTYSLKTSGDGSLFSINATTGAVTLTGDPNFEAKPEYDFTVVATDVAGNATEQDVTLVITNVDDAAPVFAAGATATGATIVENVSAGAIVYNAYATDKADMSAGVTYTLGGTDASKFNIDAQTGQVTTKAGQYDRETKATYEFTVTATDGASQTDVITVSGTVSDYDEVAPTVLNVTSTAADGSYVVGDVIDIVVTFSEAVFVTGTPQLTLETGTTDRVVNYSSGDGTDKLYFQYTVQAGDTAADLDYKATDSLALNSGTIKDAAGNAATLTLATPNATDSISDNQAIVVDTTAPTGTTIGVIADDDIINVTENTAGFNITGTGEVGSTITLSLESGATLAGGNTATVDGSGNWSIAVAAKEAGTKFKEGDERVTVTETDIAGNTGAEVHRLLDVVNTQSITGAQDGTDAAIDFSGVTVLTLTGDTTFNDFSTAKMPQKIVAAGNKITFGANSTVDLTGVTLDTVGDLDLYDNTVSITMTSNQATSFNNGNTIDLNSNSGTNGAILVTTNGDLTTQNLGSVTLTLDGATTLPNGTSDMPLSINAASNAITAGATASVANVTITNYGNLTVNSSVVLTLTSTQAAGFAGQTVSNSGTLAISDTLSGSSGVSTLNSIMGSNAGTVSATINGTAEQLASLTATSSDDGTSTLTITVNDAATARAVRRLRMRRMQRQLTSRRLV